jgi:H+-transporting ATPase
MINRLHHRRPHGEKKDEEEAGGSGNANGSGSSQQGLTDDLGEYPALDRYISTYRDEMLPQEDTGGPRKKKPWWKFWQFQSDAPHEDTRKNGPPEEWFSSDIRTGIRSEDVDERRRFSGWNELTSEKENMFVKFLSYFTGPILYGKYPCPYHRLLLLTHISHGSCRTLGCRSG